LNPVAVTKKRMLINNILFFVFEKS
jgi:hypothetical protein